MAHVLSAAERCAFLADPRVAVLSIEDTTRAPLSVPIWFAWDGAEIGLWMEANSRKARLLSTAGRCSLCMQEPLRPYRYVSLEGCVTQIAAIDWTLELTPLVRRYLDDADAERYLAALGGPAAVAGDVYVRIAPVRWRAEQL
jgi:hypothetical protein